MNGIDGAWVDATTQNTWRKQWAEDFDALATNLA
jgi:hypothetical protein